MHSLDAIALHEINLVFLCFRPIRVLRLKKSKLRKASPKSLQQEDSDAVWNELAYYKKQHKNLTIDKWVFIYITFSMAGLSKSPDYATSVDLQSDTIAMAIVSDHRSTA